MKPIEASRWAAPAVATREAVSPTGPGPIRVLILEDDPDLIDALMLALGPSYGFEVQIVAEVAGCLDRLRGGDGEGTPRFDVLLLDFVLRAGHLGTEVLREALSAGTSLHLPPVIVYSGHSGAYLINHAPEIAASKAHVLSKPFDLDELTATLRMAARPRVAE